MLRIATLIMISSILTSACTPRVLSIFAAKRDFNHCYSGEYTGLDTLIQLNGYYSTGDNPETAHSFYLYEDGFALLATFPAPELGYNRQGEVDSIDLKPIQLLNQTYHHGNYILNGDTIKMQVSSTPYQGNIGWAPTLWYKIVDSVTLSYIKPDHVKTGWGTHTVSFNKKEKNPNTNGSWLKHEKWFWCDEEDFRTWKKRN